MLMKARQSQSFQPVRLPLYRCYLREELRLRWPCVSLRWPGVCSRIPLKPRLLFICLSFVADRIRVGDLWRRHWLRPVNSSVDCVSECKQLDFSMGFFYWDRNSITLSNIFFFCHDFRVIHLTHVVLEFLCFLIKYHNYYTKLNITRTYMSDWLCRWTTVTYTLFSGRYKMLACWSQFYFILVKSVVKLSSYFLMVLVIIWLKLGQVLI